MFKPRRKGSKTGNIVSFLAAAKGKRLHSSQKEVIVTAKKKAKPPDLLSPGDKAIVNYLGLLLKKIAIVAGLSKK